VLRLFSVFLEAQAEGAAVLVLEEPEAHLHPSAIRALWALVGDFAGQKLISTHSGELLAEADILDICRLARTRNGIKAFRVTRDFLTDEETRKFKYHIRRDRGELLFARCWLLVEGESESWVYPAAARALDLNLHREGVHMVEYRQSDIGMLAKIANALGIPWYCVGDNDTNGNYIDKLKLSETDSRIARTAAAPVTTVPSCMGSLIPISSSSCRQYLSISSTIKLSKAKLILGSSSKVEVYPGRS